MLGGVLADRLHSRLVEPAPGAPPASVARAAPDSRPQPARQGLGGSLVVVLDSDSDCDALPVPVAASCQSDARLPEEPEVQFVSPDRGPTTGRQRRRQAVDPDPPQSCGDVVLVEEGD